MPPVEPPNFLSNHGLPAHRAGKALTNKLGLVYGRAASDSKHNDAAEPGTPEPRLFGTLPAVTIARVVTAFTRVSCRGSTLRLRHDPMECNDGGSLGELHDRPVEGLRG